MYVSLKSTALQDENGIPLSEKCHAEYIYKLFFLESH
jgi:hypothetical protein